MTVDWGSTLAAAQGRLHGGQAGSAQAQPHFGSSGNLLRPLGPGGGLLQPAVLPRWSQEPVAAAWAGRPQEAGGAGAVWEDVLSAARLQLRRGGVGGPAEEEEELDRARPPGGECWPAEAPRLQNDEEASGAAGGRREGGGSLRGLAAAALAGRLLMESAQGASPPASPGRGGGDGGFHGGGGLSEAAAGAVPEAALSPRSDEADGGLRRLRSGGLAAAALAGRAFAEGTSRRGGPRVLRRRGAGAGSSDSEVTDGEGLPASATGGKTAAAAAAAERRLRRASAVAAAAVAAVGTGRRRVGLDSPIFGGRFGVALGGS